MAALDGADGGASLRPPLERASLARFLETRPFRCPVRRRDGDKPQRQQGPSRDAKTQTEERIQQRTVEQIFHYPTQQVVIPQECNSERIMEQTVDVPRSASYGKDC